MAVIAHNLPAIRALARARTQFDLTTWRLEDYLNLQSFACLWGIVPGSITDEDSPFNECAHAYLAAGRALLLQLAHAPGADHKSLDALIGKIEVEMLADGASLNLCRYSDEPFNTNEVIWPRWGMIPFIRPTAMMATAALVAIGVAAVGRVAKAKCGPAARRGQRVGTTKTLQVRTRRSSAEESSAADCRRRSLTESFAVPHSELQLLRGARSATSHRSFRRGN